MLCKHIYEMHTLYACVACLSKVLAASSRNGFASFWNHCQNQKGFQRNLTVRTQSHQHAFMVTLFSKCQLSDVHFLYTCIWMCALQSFVCCTHIVFYSLYSEHIPIQKISKFPFSIWFLGCFVVSWTKRLDFIAEKDYIHTIFQ